MDKKEISIDEVQWSDEAETYLSKIDACATLDDYRQQWKEGAALYRVAEGDKTLGFYMTRFDSDAQGFEGVIYAGAGAADFDLTEVIVPFAEQQLKAFGCYSVRVHTARPGLVKKLAKMGYGAAELVLRKKIL